jgi:tetrahydromethanopterin S-methyltransferase subunit G
MPFDVLRWLVQYLHVMSGVLWFGAGFYTTIVQLPALLTLPPPQRMPAIVALGPRQIRYIVRLAEVTIALGIINAILTGRLGRLGETIGTLWGWVIGLGFILAIALYVLLQTNVKPAIFRVIAVSRAAQEGNATSTSELPVLARRIRTLGYVQMAIGAVIVLLMVTARFS